MSNKSKQTLAGLFPGADFTLDEGAIQLRAFAEKYPEMSFNEDTNAVIFSTEDIEFKIRTDQDFNTKNLTVFVGTITAFCPETVVFNTGYLGSIAEVFKSLQAGWADLEVEDGDI